jgi:hypothetical protein
MSFDLKLPNITATSNEGKVEQIRSYLYQLTEQLKWALNSIEVGNGGYIVRNQSVAKETAQEEAKATFNSIKSLIISSAEVVNAYYEKIGEKFSGEYVAKSDFGEYTEQTQQYIEKSSTDIESLYTNIQKIITDIESIIEVNAHIRSGLLYTDDDGVPIYGLEIGQINKIDGVEVFNKYTRFTSDRISFYDKNDTEVAYISDYKLYIANVEVISSYQVGGLKDIVLSNGDVVTKWVRRR